MQNFDESRKIRIDSKNIKSKCSIFWFSSTTLSVFLKQTFEKFVNRSKCRIRSQYWVRTSLMMQICWMSSKLKRNLSTMIWSTKVLKLISTRWMKVFTIIVEHINFEHRTFSWRYVEKDQSIYEIEFIVTILLISLTKIKKCYWTLNASIACVNLHLSNMLNHKRNKNTSTKWTNFFVKFNKLTQKLRLF